MKIINNKKPMLLLSFLLLFSASYILARTYYITDLKNKIETIVATNLEMRHFQGMNYDLTGIGPFLKFNIESQKDFEISHLKIQSGKHILERYYDHKDHIFYDISQIKTHFERTKIEVVFKFTFKSIMRISLFSLISSFLILVIFYLLKKTLSLQNEKNFSHLAQQVSHDIRSPLAALNIAISRLEGVDENDKILINSAYRRINDIANNLLKTHKKGYSTNKELILISQIIETIVREKMILVSNRSIEIKTNYNGKSDEGFSLINRIEIERVLSNLINNSIESFGNRGGFVEISLTVATEILISIKDNGPGIPAELLEEFEKSGHTIRSNKMDGSGLGLSHAIKTLRNNDGELEIRSSRNHGTEIILKIPLTDPPSWFFTTINLASYDKIIILDNDDSIHRIWKEKLKFHSIETEHFYISEDFVKWFSNHATNKKFLFIFDNDLKYESSNGMDIIKKFDLQKNSLLLFNFLDDSKIVTLRHTENILTFPKSMIKFLKVQNENHNNKYDFILIDNDKYIRMAWKSEAKRSKLNILTFHSVEDFIQNSKHLEKDIPIFIDSQLDNGIRGEEASKEIFDLNFTNLRLSTGYSPEQIIKPHWIRDIVGKSPLCLPEMIQNT